MLRDLHPASDLERYEILSSYGGYPITVEQPATPICDAIQMDLRLRRENSARRQRELRRKAGIGR